ncbi:hypothetical protein SAMN05421736_10640 [Evansella caseinilytica]|uniref:Uncharacterized protein n=1 Tax=Evansella caseinilytica TaxID=1503961 RepID=A0A1H3Q6F3_9BACI|nr:hypothetical protein SAMN05421736_10640 [Evansella caseinilytica]
MSLLTLIFFACILTAPASANNSTLDTRQLVPEFEMGLNESDLTGAITPDLDHGITINDSEFSAMSNDLVEGHLLNHDDILTTNDPMDFYFFSVPDERNIILRILSNNSNYRVDIYEVDWSTGTAYPTNFGTSSGNTVIGSGLYASDWALVVTSTGTVGDTYSVQMNIASSGGTIISASAALQSVVVRYPNNDLYLNEHYIANTTEAANTNPHLDWERRFYFSYDGNYQSRTHDISDARVSYISTRANYQSSYASSNNVVLIVLNIDTLFTYFESEFRSGPPTYYYSSFVDTTGRTTPRRLDSIDLARNPDILVYDLNTNKVIDFVSNLNYYYARGIEPAPVVTYYD